MKKLQHRIMLLFVLGLGTLKAQVYESSTNVYWEGAGFHKDTVRVAQDDKWAAGLMPSVNDYQVKDIIKLQIIENPAVVYPDSFRCTVTLNIVRWDINGTSSSTIKELQVSYAGNEYVIDTPVSYYVFYGSYKDSVIITNIKASGFPDTILSVFRLESSVEVFRDYINLNCDSFIIEETYQEYLPGQDELLVYWDDTYPPAEEMELEWTFYDTYSNISFGTYDEYFRNNATRVIVKDCQYRIPLLYDAGYLYWRVRPVRITSYGERKQGKWNELTFSNLYNVTGHEPKLNWQSTISFAEEGKRKAVASYFDGASKSRQSVTKLNTNDIAVVAETLYDGEGRDVAGVLPAPTTDSVIQHFAHFNKNASGNSYTWQDLDSLGYCPDVPKVMSISSGASRYYSPNNPNRNIYENRYIDDAKGYPFTQKQYTDDLTGRVRRTSGPGDSLKMGAGRETVYYYGAPSQGELNRLFGNEVGDASHYFKNMQLDPNGQVSVSYLDMRGHTIATALAGVPVNVDLDTLSDYRADTIIHDAIITAKNQQIEGLSIKSSREILVASEGVHKFYYTLFPESMQLKSCDSSLYCFDCVYDLKIRITGDCNSAGLPGGEPFIFVDSNYTMAGALEYYFDTTCANSPAPIIDSFNLTLPIGSYTLTKELSINPNALEYYYNYYVRNDTCIKTFSDFYGEALSNINSQDCFINCEQCRQALGDSSGYLTDYISKLFEADSTIVPGRNDTITAFNLYGQLRKTCDLICNDYSICQQKLDLLIKDVSPSGQYATYVVDENSGLYSVADTTSVFYSNGTSVYPYTPLYSDPSIVYLNEYGQPDSVYIDFDEDGELDSLVSPNSLPVSTFILNWKPSWANVLLPYHPEYCYWHFCDNNESSNSFDDLMMTTDSYQAAVDSGLLNPLSMLAGNAGGYSPGSHPDPFFQPSGLGAGYNTAMQNKLTSFTAGWSIWQTAMFAVQCDSTETACFHCKEDRYWLTFRGLYLGAKQKFLDSAMKDSCNLSIDFESSPYLGKIPRFPMLSDSLESIASTLGVNDNDPIDTAQVFQNYQDVVSDGPSFACKGYAPSWWYALRNCGFDMSLGSSDSVTVINELIAVCELGRDNTHPYGSSSGAPATVTPNGNHNFEEALAWAYNTLNYPNVYSPSVSCASLLISSPGPYDNPIVYIPTTVINRPDSCVCDNINQYYASYVATTDTFNTTFAAYLQQKGIAISGDDVALLRNSCSDPACDELQHPVSLPYDFECNKVCVNCYQLTNAYAEFVNIFPDVQTSENYLTLLATYMNREFHMNLTAMEYINFMQDSCQYSFPEPPAPVCDTLYAIDDYYDTDSLHLDTLDVLANDNGVNDGFITLIQQGAHGEATLSYAETYFVYQPYDTTNAADTLIYSVCQYCNGTQYCDTATVYINSGDGGMMMMGGGGEYNMSQEGGDASGETDTGGGLNSLLPYPFKYRRPASSGNNGQNAPMPLPDFDLFPDDSVSVESATASLGNALNSGNRSGDSLIDALSQQALNANQPPLQMQENMLLSEGGGGYTPNFISWQPTWCDSIAASISNYISYYLPGNYSPNNLINQLNSDLGGWHNFAYWQAQIDSCGLGCPQVVNCYVAQMTVNDFRTAYPEFQNAAPEQFLTNYLNSRYSANLYPLPPVWISPEDWLPALRCCGISYPHDTTVAYCDQLQEAITRYNIALDNHTPNMWDFRSTLNSVMGWGHYDDSLATWVENDLSYWIQQMDSCGMSCDSNIISCSLFAQALDTFYAAFPQYATHCPAFILTTYLRNSPVGYTNIQNYNDWKTVAACCGLTLPEDTVASACDTVALWRLNVLNVENMLELQDTCLPAFAWQILLNIDNDEFVPLDSIFAMLNSCGYPLPDTCFTPYSTFCDTVELANLIYVHVVENSNDPPDLPEVYNVLFNRELSLAEVIYAGSQCEPAWLCERLHEIDTVFIGLGCIEPYVWTAAVNVLTDSDEDYAFWHDVFFACGTLPNFCTDTATRCDSIRAINDMRLRILSTYEIKDTAEFTEEFVTRILGYTLTMEQMDSIATGACHCDDWDDIADIMGVLYPGYAVGAPCDPAWALVAVVNAYLGLPPGTLQYEEICQQATFCNHPCPDTCHNAIGTSLCDSLFAARDLFNQVNSNFNLENDSIPIFEHIVATTLGYSMSYSEILATINGCLSSGPLLCNRPLFPTVIQPDDSCLLVQQEYAYHEAAIQYDNYIRNLHDDFINKYVGKCLSVRDTVEHERNNGEFHFTLYYYDLPGNLVKTVPPAGVNLDGSGDHTMATYYAYNVANQVVGQVTPDAGKTETWYDKIGLPVFSRNAKQLAKNQISYTKYDDLKRTVEVGQYGGFTTDYAGLDWAVFNGGVVSLDGTQVTKTFYDEDTFHLGLVNLRNRVASMTYEDEDEGNVATYDYGVHYSYDLHGNVSDLKREFSHWSYLGQTFIDIGYKYDLISGKVNEVVYMRNDPRQSLWQRYEYDAENRLTDVYTSHDSTYWEHDAYYKYCLHGPLARVVLGSKQVQGIDYAYTLQGWIKTVNSSSLLPTNDIGGDGDGPSDITARDEVGFTLGYYKGDYSAIGLGAGGTLNSGNLAMADRTNLQVASLFNGNIGSMEVNIGKFSQPLGYRYRYDQLHRIKQARVFDGLDTSTNVWDNSTPIEAYGANYEYDPNGNIMQLNRNGAPSLTPMDSFTYHYVTGTNKLDYVSDVVSGSNYSVDIDNQSSGNYAYDEIGNLIKDVAGCIDSIRWTVYGKVWRVFKCNGDSISFAYDPTGNRLLKEVWHDSLQRKEQIYYLRDVTGNEMAMYKWVNEDTLSLEQQPIYGSSRLGVWNRNQHITSIADTGASSPPAPDPMTDSVSYWQAGRKRYELTNHLGNVLATVSDRKLPVYVSNAFNHYKAEVTSAQDYYPFGMTMPEREYQSGMATNCQSYKDTCTLTDAFCDFESVFKYKAFSFYNNDIRWLPLLSTQRNIDTFTYNGSRMLKMKTEHTDSGLYAYADDTLQPNKAYTVEWEQYRFGGATTVGYVVFYYNGSSWVTLASGTNNSDGIKSTSFNTTGYTLHRLRFYMTTSPAVGKYVLFDNIKFSYADSCMVTPCCETSMQGVVSAPLNNSFNAATKVGNEVYDGGQRWYPYQPYRTNIDTFTYSGSRKLKISADSIAFYAGAEITVPRGKMCTLSFEQYLFGGATVGEARLYYKVGSDWISYTNSPMTGNGTHTVTFTSPPYTTEHRILLYVKTGYGAGSYMLIDNLKLSYPDSIETLNCTGVADGLANGRNSYRFGFNGQEKDDEVYGSDNLMTAEFWEYDTRLGRRWNTDPVTEADISPYACFYNNPILLNDPTGACPTCPTPEGEGKQEGDHTTTTFTHTGLHGITWNEKKDWYWHKGEGDKAGSWEDSEQFYNHHKDIIAQAALAVDPFQQNFNDFASTESRQAYINAYAAKADLSSDFADFAQRYAGTALADYHAKAGTGRIDYSPFNVEDFIMVGQVFKSLASFAVFSDVPITKAAQREAFDLYKTSRGGTETLLEIQTSTGVQRVSTEFSHTVISQAAQRKYALRFWLVNNRLNVWKLNTIQHSLVDRMRFRFLRSGIKPDVGWGLKYKYNWFTKF